MIIIMDWGGVLTRGKYTPMLYAELNRSCGLRSVSLEELDELVVSVETVPCSAGDFAALLKERFGCAVEQDKLAQALRASIRMRHDMFDVIERLAEEHTLVLASNNFDFVTDILREEYQEFLAFFDQAFFSNEMGVRKPDREFFSKLLDGLGADPADCVFVDDKTVNVDAAKDAGMRGIVFTDTAAFLAELNL